MFSIVLVRQALIPLIVAVSSSCSAVKYSRLRPDYESVDKTKVKRLVVMTQPYPAGSKAVAELWSKIARRYVNQKRNFLAKTEQVDAGEALNLQGTCTAGMDGVLWLKPTLEARGKGMAANVVAKLLRCTDGEEVWAAEAGGSWPSDDSTLEAFTAQYVSELGPEVGPYAAPSFHLLKAALDTMPDPILSDDDVSEKIELGD